MFVGGCESYLLIKKHTAYTNTFTFITSCSVLLLALINAYKHAWMGIFSFHLWLRPFVSTCIIIFFKARDNGSPSLESNATVQVIIDDVNDNPPRFEQPTYNVSLRESTFIRTTVRVFKSVALVTSLVHVIAFLDD